MPLVGSNKSPLFNSVESFILPSIHSRASSFGISNLIKESVISGEIETCSVEGRILSSESFENKLELQFVLILLTVKSKFAVESPSKLLGFNSTQALLIVISFSSK